MSMINYASREINCKIVYYGPGLGGKTTNLEYVYGKVSPDTPYDSLRVLCASVVKDVNHRDTEAIVTKQPTTITMNAADEIAIHSEQAFAPATVLHNQDPRIIAVQLIRVVQSP
jgi:GTPase SAR1 family protein